MCLPSHTAPHLNFTITYKGSVEFQMEIKIVCRRGFGDFTLLFCIGRLRNVQTHAIVLLIISFVFPCPRCRRRRGLLKVAIMKRRPTHPVNKKRRNMPCIVFYSIQSFLN